MLNFYLLAYSYVRVLVHQLQSGKHLLNDKQTSFYITICINLLVGP